VTPDTLLTLANLTVARRPDRGPTTHPDPLAHPGTAAHALGRGRVDACELDALRELHRTIVTLVDRLLGGGSAARPAARLTRLAGPSVATVKLDVDDGRSVGTQFTWSEPTATATLARQVVLELGEIEVARLKRCERVECDLVFYDVTRPGTQRWHAESPCGNRERQRRHRLRRSDP
jgi:predicted RNA-binding Zn ribbon-like protein